MLRSKKMLVVLANLVLLLIFFNYSVFKKEQTLANGNLILLELAPVDPRSLMQGDYMQLNYAINNNLQNRDSLSSRGYAIVKRNEKKVAELVRFQEGNKPVYAGEYPIKYFKTDWSINLGAESFFFEEGQAETYANAKYGGLKTDENGNSILVGLYDEDHKQILPKRKEK